MKKKYISPIISSYHIDCESLLNGASQTGSTDYTGKDYNSGINSDVKKTDGENIDIELSKSNGSSLWDFDEE